MTQDELRSRTLDAQGMGSWENFQCSLKLFFFLKTGENSLSSAFCASDLWNHGALLTLKLFPVALSQLYSAVYMPDYSQENKFETFKLSLTIA